MGDEKDLTNEQDLKYPDGDPQNGGPGALNPSLESPEDDLPDWVKDPQRAYAQIQKLRDESAKYRQLKQQEEDRRRSELEEQGNFKALYEELKAQHDGTASKLEAYEQKVKGAVEKRLESLPKSISSLLSGLEPAEALAWLEANADEFQPKPKAPQMDAGVSGDRPDSLNLSAEQLQIAQRMGIAPEKFAEQLKARASR